MWRLPARKIGVGVSIAWYNYAFTMCELLASIYRVHLISVLWPFCDVICCSSDSYSCIKITVQKSAKSRRGFESITNITAKSRRSIYCTACT